MVSIRILQTITPQYAQIHQPDSASMPIATPYLTMALGAGSATPLQMAPPFRICHRRISHRAVRDSEGLDDGGNVLAQAQPARCRRIAAGIDPATPSS